jgi:radical SAM-linked protein
MLGDKFRFRFAKTGTLRLLSHHDMMRCLERMLRRASLPFKSTQGFHPGPRVVFAQSLPLGVIGRDEVVEIEFTHECESDVVLAAMNAQAPIGLSFISASVVPMKATAIPRRVVYELALPVERVEETRTAAEALLAQEKIWVERLRPTPKRLNIRPYVREAACGFAGAAGEAASGFSIRLDLWVTGTGSARADELTRLLDLDDLLEAGVVLERTRIELRDEVANTPDNPPDGPADSQTLDPAEIAALTRQDEEPNHAAAASWGLSPSGPVVE